MKEQEYNLKHLTKCPLCKTNYKHSQSLVLKEDSMRTIFHMTCSNCGTAMLVFVSSGQQGVVSMSLATDLNSQEAKVLIKGRSIETNNVLKVYESLK
ncbi:MAG TPA: hypothetical protein ENJ27_01840 [Candidatus Moranbacteria bacterium]|nr:hypothetical protein [Candidatus Moranbacteria bacterium]